MLAASIDDPAVLLDEHAGMSKLVFHGVNLDGVDGHLDPAAQHVVVDAHHVVDGDMVCGEESIFF